MPEGRFIYRHLSKLSYDQIEEALETINHHDMKVLHRNNNLRKDGKYIHILENPTPTIHLLAEDLGTLAEPYDPIKMPTEQFEPPANEQHVAITAENTEAPPKQEEPPPEEDVQV